MNPFGNHFEHRYWGGRLIKEGTDDAGLALVGNNLRDNLGAPPASIRTSAKEEASRRSSSHMFKGTGKCG